MIVNDDPLQLRIGATILGREGFKVFSCPSAEEGLRLLSELSAVNVIVTDLYMPGIDGWRFCRLLRSAAFRQFNRIPILVVSAIFSGADAEELTVQLGADGFLAAPYEPATLCRAVRGLLVDTKPVSSKTVLLVEPDVGLAQELTALFTAAGYRVAQAADGAQALSRFNQEPSQIVLLDGDYTEVMAPGLIETIKQPGTATVVIVMTSANSADLAMDLLRKGADNQMEKPRCAKSSCRYARAWCANERCCASKSSCKSAPSGCATARSAIAACSKTPAMASPPTRSTG